MDEYESPMWPDQSLLDSVFSQLGISKDGVVDDSDYAKKLQGLTGEPYNKLEMTRYHGEPLSDDDITTMAMVELFNNNSGMTSEQFAEFLQGDGKSQLEELKKKYMDKYPLFKDKSGNPIEQINLSQKKDIANYFMTDVGKRMHQVTHGVYYPDKTSESVKKTGAASDEFEALYKVILPKLLLIRKMQHYKTQEQLMKQFGMNNTQLAQYLVKLMNDAEKDIQNYLKKGVLISPLLGRNYLKLYMNS